MVALSPAARRIVSALAAALGITRVRAARARRRQRQEELCLVLSKELGRLSEQLHKANLIQYHHLIVEQLDRAIDDPALAAALSTLGDLSERERRQMLFANREYATNLLAYRVGMYDWDELLGGLRVLCRNPVFTMYWQRTTEHRMSLPVESLEGRAGRAVDAMMDELAEDPEEWWVVGPSQPDERDA